jgi:non-ribosomal peptide synthetase component F
MINLEEFDGKGPSKHPVWHGGLKVRVDAVSNIHQLAHAPAEALPKLQNHALLTGTQLQAQVHLPAKSNDVKATFLSEAGCRGPNRMIAEGQKF